MMNDSAGQAAMAKEAKTRHERERNKVHARNTRARKKQHLEHLKTRIEQLRKEQEQTEADQSSLANAREARFQACRKAVISALELRSSRCMDKEAWMKVITPAFRCTLPVTAYRYYDMHEVVNGRRVLFGFESLSRDISSLSVLCDSIFCHGKGGSSSQARLTCTLAAEGCFDCDEKCFMSTVNLTLQVSDSSPEDPKCEIEGMVSAQLELGSAATASDKVKEGGADLELPVPRVEVLDLYFSPMAFRMQLESVFGWNLRPPLQLEEARQIGSVACAVLSGTKPHSVVHANEGWKQEYQSRTLSAGDGLGLTLSASLMPDDACGTKLEAALAAAEDSGCAGLVQMDPHSLIHIYPIRSEGNLTIWHCAYIVCMLINCSTDN